MTPDRLYRPSLSSLKRLYKIQKTADRDRSVILALTTVLGMIVGGGGVLYWRENKMLARAQAEAAVAQPRIDLLKLRSQVLEHKVKLIEHFPDTDRGAFVQNILDHCDGLDRRLLQELDRAVDGAYDGRKRVVVLEAELRALGLEVAQVLSAPAGDGESLELGAAISPPPDDPASTAHEVFFASGLAFDRLIAHIAAVEKVKADVLAAKRLPVEQQQAETELLTLIRAANATGTATRQPFPIPFEVGLLEDGALDTAELATVLEVACHSYGELIGRSVLAGGPNPDWNQERTITGKVVIRLEDATPPALFSGAGLPSGTLVGREERGIHLTLVGYGRDEADARRFSKNVASALASGYISVWLSSNRPISSQTLIVVSDTRATYINSQIAAVASLLDADLVAYRADAKARWRASYYAP